MPMNGRAREVEIPTSRGGQEIDGDDGDPQVDVISAPTSFNVRSSEVLADHQKQDVSRQRQPKARTACPCCKRPESAAASAPLASPLASPALSSQSKPSGCFERRRSGRKREVPQGINPLEPQPPIETLKHLRDDWECESGVTEMREVWGYPRVGGKARFRCGGACITGPPEIDNKFSCCAVSSIVMPATFFFLVCCPDLMEDYPYIPIGGGISFVLTLIMMAITSHTDPGIIPRPALQLLIPGLQEEVAEAIGLKGRPGGMREDVMNCIANPFVMAELEPLGYWWCRWCHMIQPPKAKHCRDCDCCVLREDHHCPFLNNCIGQRNYAYFYGFVTFLICMGAFVVFGTLIWMVGLNNWGLPRKGDHQKPQDLAITITGWIVIVIPGLLLVAITCFGLFHLHLIIRGRTTREVLTGRLVGDAKETLLARRGPSLLRLEAKIEFPPECDYLHAGDI